MKSEHPVTSPTVLAVDDSADILSMINGLLKGVYRVRLANNGAKALELVASVPPDLILLDILMPDMDGYEVCRRLKENSETSHIPIIFLTSKTESRDEIKGFELGAVDYITKPISPSKLMARVKTHLTLKGAADFLRDKNEYLEQRVQERTAELLDANARLLQSQKMEAVGQLAGGLAHDFNNILSIINGYSTLIEEEIVRDQHLKSYCRKILSASRRGADLTQSILAFSRTQVMKPQSQNLNWIISKVGKIIEKIIDANIKYKALVKVVSLPVHVDAGQIEQVLINLCNNACDAMPAGGELTITTDMVLVDADFISANHLCKSGRYAVIKVSDTGIGMDEPTRLKIFEPFFTTKEVGKGTGLGLAMVHGIIEQHGGCVDVLTAPGEGSLFNVYIPLDEQETCESDLTAVVKSEVTGGSETLLVAEDDAELLEFMSEILTRRGYKVILAMDGAEAVEQFRKNSEEIRLIIMDILMPHKSGKQACDEIKKIAHDVKVLFSSGYGAKVIEQQGLVLESLDFIAKPIQPAELLPKIREMLDR
ncbi:MAG: response regulator [Desulfuromonadaceae bacterium]|nr:response regulator [Desulfuromonadaceae bacterium]